MGSSQYETEQMEVQITHLHDRLIKDYQHLRGSKSRRSFIYFSLKIIGVFMIPYLIIRLFLAFKVSKLSFLEVLQTLAQRELLVISITATVWAFYEFIYAKRNLSTVEDIESTRYEMEKLIEVYEKTLNLPAIRKSLKDSGQSTAAFDTFSISLSDYGVEESFGGKNYLFSRIWHAIMDDGPDKRYAVICPICRHHNGIIDQSEIASLKYKCPFCKNKVTATKLVPEKKKRVVTSDDLPDLQMPTD